MNNIDIVNSVTCRIETPNGKGTAILLNIVQQNTLYMLTAKHCLLGKDFNQNIEISDIEIFVPTNTDEKFRSFNLDKTAQILLPPDPIDAAIIVLKTLKKINIPQIELLNIKYTDRNCLFRGYPQAYGSLKGITIRPVNYTDHNIVTTTISLSTIDSEPLYNCEGFSGSGVFCEVDNQLFLTGLIYELEEVFQRFPVCDLSFLNPLLSSHNLHEIEFRTLPLNKSISDDIKTLIKKTHLVLDGINDKLGNELFLKRNDVDKDFRNKFSDNRLLILKGLAGIGKSAYAKSIMLRLRDSNYAVLAFKADSFAKNSIEESFSYTKNGFDDIFAQLGQTQQTIILIDSLEKLLEIGSYEPLKEFLLICKQFKHVKIIVTCRSFAYQQLIFELNHVFPKYDFIEIPLLDDNELGKVEKHFSYITKLLQNKSFKKILKRPFYLNLAILHSELFQDKKLISEKEFRGLVWDKVIAKRNSKRASTFEKIALQRAISMRLYVRLENADALIIEQLSNDDIILVEENLREAYSPSHDIYEDIALIRIIERFFQEKQNTFDFFNKLNGKEPAMRRAFRLWITDQLLEVSISLTVFISDILAETKIAQYWKDEIIVAILQSEYCQNFFDSNQELLNKDNYAILLRFIHLLRTTCSEPDEKLIQTLQNPNQGNYYQWLYLKPIGIGWQVLLNYIYEHLHGLDNHRHLIVRLILKDWAKKLFPHTTLPLESSAVGKILLDVLEEAKNHYSSNGNWNKESYSKKDINEVIIILFNLCSILKTEIFNLIETAHTYDTEKNENYHGKAFYKSIIDLSISGIYSKEICQTFPDLVCKIARKNWLTTPIKHITSIEYEFDLPLGFDYFPAGIYKTPIRFLLYFHPAKALNLIIRVLNHATEAYAKSSRGKNSGITEVKIYHADGSSSTQKGNAVLWGMYRGSVESTPGLLQSILMSLENWLLELCQIKEPEMLQLIEYTYSYLLKNSATVATTAVLASVALAYPKKMGQLCFPILKVREFYNWDINRTVGDKTPLAPYDNKIAFAQEERYKSNQLPHRKLMLENLVTQLQVSKYWNEINEIIDHFQNAVKPEDKLWKLALNRMDIRKYQVDESIELPEKNQIALTPKIDEELVEIVEANQNYSEFISKAAYITNWAKEVYEDKESAEKSVKKWQQEYKSYHEMVNIEDESMRLRMYGDPTYLAAIGIKCFQSSLKKEELSWCINIILDAINAYIVKNIKRDPRFETTIYLEAAIQTVPLILLLERDDEIRVKTKVIIFLSLLHLVSHKMEYPFESIRNQLWIIDEEFAQSCLAGMLEYAKLHRKYYPFYTGKEELQKQEIALAECVCKNKVELDMTNLSFETHSHWYLGFAIQIIPFNTQNDVHLSLIKRFFQLLFKALNQKEKGNQQPGMTDIKTQFKQYFAVFLLSQPKHRSQALFSEILDYIFLEKQKKYHETYDFIKQILEWIIFEGEKVESSFFWNLWEILESKIKTSKKPYFISYLFLSSLWWNPNEDDWLPLKNKKHYLQSLITELGHYNISSVVKLLSGIGAKRLLPESLICLKTALKSTSQPLQELNDSTTFLDTEKLIQIIYDKHLNDIKVNNEHRDSFLYLLDSMINLGSSLAFIIRERVISI